MRVSVIVCTHNRDYAITPCLDSIHTALTRAALSTAEAELVVVNNASTDDTAGRLRAWAGQASFPCHIVEEPRLGTSKARNAGLAAAKGELLIFTDDDCRLHPQHITDALRYDAADTEPVMRGGRIELGDPDDLPYTIKTDDTRRRWEKRNRDARYTDLVKTIIGCNWAMRREVTDRVGRFDERLGAATPACSAEDVDYVMRAYLADIAIEYVPDMTVYHFHGRKTAESIRALMRIYCIGAGALFAKYAFRHPDFCRPFSWNIKNRINEIRNQTILFDPELGITYHEVLRHNLLGMYRYWKSLIRL